MSKERGEMVGERSKQFTFEGKRIWRRGCDFSQKREMTWSSD